MEDATFPAFPIHHFVPLSILGRRSGPKLATNLPEVCISLAYFIHCAMETDRRQGQPMKIPRVVSFCPSIGSISLFPLRAASDTTGAKKPGAPKPLSSPHFNTNHSNSAQGPGSHGRYVMFSSIMLCIMQLTDHDPLSMVPVLLSSIQSIRISDGLRRLYQNRLASTKY